MTTELGTLYLYLSGIICFVMACGVGANDVANAIGTSVGAKALKIRTAIIIAVIFEAAGAMLAGGEVTNTIRNQIINPDFFMINNEILIYGMMASSLSAGTWLIIASYKGWPVSTTHTLIGAIIGFGGFVIGPEAVIWSKVFDIILSWIVTPILAGFFAYFVFATIQSSILNRKQILKYAKIYLPVYVAISAIILSYSTATKGINHLGYDISQTLEFIVAISFGLGMALLSYIILYHIDSNVDAALIDQSKQVENYFGVLMIFTACAMAFAHGSNDVANAIGPLSAIVDVVYDTNSAYIPSWILMIGASGIVIGLITYGYKIITTIGNNITTLTPSRGFAAEISAASTVIMASVIGLPVSTTQTLVGAILGVGFAGGISAINLTVVRKIFLSWSITLPAGAILSVVFYYILFVLFTAF